MAQQFPCDICQQEYAIQMLTNLDSGEVISMGPSCLAMFYGHSALAAMGAGEHKGPATKCQACRRFHERMTTPAAPTGADGADNGDGLTQVVAPDDAAAGDVSRETSDDDHADMHSETVEGTP